MDARAAIPEEARNKAGAYARSLAPWNKDLPWYLVGIEGAVALALDCISSSHRMLPTIPFGHYWR